MSSAYSPQKSRTLAEGTSAAHGSGAERAAAFAEFERYHSAERMLLLAAEVEFLRDVVRQASRIRYSADIGYVEVRHVFEALRAMQAAAPLGSVALGA